MVAERQGNEMKTVVVVLCALLATFVVAVFCAIHREPLFGLIGGIATGCAILKLAEKVGWA